MQRTEELRNSFVAATPSDVHSHTIQNVYETSRCAANLILIDRCKIATKSTWDELQGGLSCFFQALKEKDDRTVHQLSTAHMQSSC